MVIDILRDIIDGNIPKMESFDPLKKEDILKSMESVIEFFGESTRETLEDFYNQKYFYTFSDETRVVKRFTRWLSTI